VTTTRSPRLAVLLGALVPGAGHAYAGRSGRALAWFGIVSVLTFVGWALTGPLFLSQHRLELPLAGKLALPTAIPEVANLIETMVAQAWLRVVEPDSAPSETAPLGAVLTASAAILNVVAMSEAHWLCRGGAFGGGARSPAIAAMLAWLVPGAGHWWLGRRGKGAIAGAALVLTFVLGVVLAEGTVVQRPRDQYFWSGEILLGLPAIVASLADAGRRVQHEMPLAELGLLCATVAGLMNVLLMLDAYATAERDLAPRPTTSPAREREATARAA